MQTFGAWSLIPPAVVVLLAIRTKLAIEPLLAGCLVGYAMISKTHFFGEMIESFTQVMQNELMVWIIIVCSLYGALIQLIVGSGGIAAFSQWMLRHIKTKKAALLSTWAFGSFLFMDDYLNALTTGNTMKKMTDHFNIPREMLAFVISSTAVPICVIVPISTWVIFIGKLMEMNHLVPAGKGITSYLHIIPYICYGWAQYIVVLLVIVGVIPVIGKMKKALKRADTTQQLIPPNSEGFLIEEVVFNPSKKGSTFYLIIPLAVLIGATLFFNFDALKGVVVALIFTAIYYRIKKIATITTLSNAAINGIKSMLFALVLLLLSYLLKNVGDQMGLTNYIIDSVIPHVNKAVLPLAIFLSLGLVSFATGNSWGLYAIAIPIVIPLSAALHANNWLCIGAVVSAGAFGAHACFYSDATILTSQGTECNNYQHGITQLPFAVISFFIACIGYLILGYALR